MKRCSCHDRMHYLGLSAQSAAGRRKTKEGRFARRPARSILLFAPTSAFFLFDFNRFCEGDIPQPVFLS